MLLKGKIAAITGGTAGIGLGIAKAFIAEGASVALMARNPEKGQRALTELNIGDRGLFVAGDVMNQESMEGFVAKTISHFGQLDILVNNAGGATDLVPLAQLSDESWDEAMKWNLYSTFWSMRAALQHMLERQTGRIINISSIEGKVGKAVFGPYTAAKHGVNGLTKTAAQEVGTSGITVNAICPGLVITDVIKANGPDTAAAMGMTFDEMVQMFSADSAVKRPITIEEVAAVAVMLASDAGSGMTGACLSVDGGTSPY